MSKYEFRVPRVILRFLKLPPQFLYRIGLGPVYGRFVLLLTTVGRKTGKKRVTPLQYEEINGSIYVASALGKKSDWVQNILADNHVFVRVRNKKFNGLGEVITDFVEIADFLQLRLRRHPLMVKAIMRREGLPKNYTRADLEQYARERVIVIIRPVARSEG